jgi:glycosyltransferase involved in cell wall biosynthesis
MGDNFASGHPDPEGRSSMTPSHVTTSHSPLVSIIIPTYVKTPGDMALLNETLATVGTQTCSDFEVIVVDDGSPLVLQGLPQRTHVIRQDNAGPAAARNTGITESRGEYLVFLDADDHLLAPALEAGLAAFAAHPECGFVIGPREEMTFQGAPVTWQVPVPPVQRELYNSLLGFDWYIIPPSSAMFRRDSVSTVGGFQDPWGADDLDFYLRMSQRFTAWCYQSPAVTRYRRYSTSSSRDGARMLQSIRAVYDRQWPIVHGNQEGEAAFHRGLQQLTEIFLDCLIENVEDRLRAGDRTGAIRTARLLASESPRRWHALVASGGAVAGSLVPEVATGPSADGHS